MIRMEGKFDYKELKLNEIFKNLMKFPFLIQVALPSNNIKKLEKDYQNLLIEKQIRIITLKLIKEKLGHSFRSEIYREMMERREIVCE